MTNKPTPGFRTLRVHPAPARDPSRDKPLPDGSRPRFADLVKRRQAVPAAEPAAQRPGAALAIEWPVDETAADDPPAEAETPSAKDDPGTAAPPPDAGTPPVEAVAGPLPTRPADAVLEPHDERLVAQLVSTVTRFCNDPAVRDGEGWQVRIRLREDVLPSTGLHLSLSPHWLLLRFETDDERSRRLVSTHRASLESQLGRALVPRREVSITFD